MGLPLSALAYAAWKGKSAPPNRTHSSAVPIARSVGVVAALAVTLTLLATVGVGALPAIMVDAMHANFWWRDVAAPPIALIFVASIVLQWRRRSSVLDLWLLVVMWAWFIEILLLSLTSYRFSLVWYAGRIFGLLSSSFVLLVLLSESTMLYARLAASVAAQERAREHQRMTVEVMLASIAHELHQPLSAIVVNATAGLRMLFRRSPDWDNARATLEDINRDGRRATEIVESVRTMFSVSHDTVKLDINDLIREALTIVRMDLKNYGISVHFDEAALPVVRGHRGQLLQVVLNIVANAVDAMTEAHDRTRQLNIQSSMQGLDQVSITIQDSGKGISPEDGQRLTLNIAVAICRSIVEGHGGRLSVSPVDGYGCVFSISLPVAASDEPKTVQTNRALAG